jgi:ribosomal protein S12 methylthiotransferase
MKVRTYRKDVINVISLGCSKNLVDSENLITQLKANQFEVFHDEPKNQANIVIVNTCGFIDVAKQESIDTILEYAGIKGKGGIEKLYVTGCLSQRYKDELAIEIPEVDAWFGTLELPGLLGKLNADYKHELLGERIITTPSHYAYLKISEGCNRTCSFCAIPLMRGKHVSQPIELLVKETQNFARHGVKELILIAQELTYYGLDIYKKRALPELLEKLAAIEGIEWIRLHYAYPSKFPLEILEIIARENKICKYLDIPLQHGSNEVLQRMKRQITRSETEQLISNIREKVPGIALRTTMMVGFPGETEEEFLEMCDFVNTHKFDRLGVFQYSHEENTSAFELQDDIPIELKAERANKLMTIQQEIAANLNKMKIGKTYKVLFDRKEGGYFVGRTEADAPEVDNEVLVNVNSHYIRIGDFVDVKITDATEFDLFGEVVK